MLTELPTTWDEAAHHVLLVLRRRFTPVYGARAARKGQPFRLVEGPRLGPLQSLLVLQLDDAQVYVQHHHLTSWKIDAATALSTGLQNVAADAHVGLAVNADGLIHVNGDVEASARLIVPGWLQSIGSQFGSAPIAVVPDEGEIFVGRKDDPVQLAALLKHARRSVHMASHPLTAAPFWLDEDVQVAPYPVRPDDPLATQVASAHAQALVQLYDDQAEVMLDDLDDGTVLAGVQVLYHGLTMAPVTVSNWTPGPPTLLPRTQLVRMACEGKVFTLTWEALEKALGSRVEMVPGLEPRRALLVGPLSTDESQQVRAASIQLPLLSHPAFPKKPEPKPGDAV